MINCSEHQSYINIRVFVTGPVFCLFTSFGTTRGQGIIRVVVVVLVAVATFFGHSHFLEDLDF